MEKPKSVRVRFAPSPTGDPHIGSIWTALFNWIFAKQHNGTFIMRLEDTDQKRLIPGSVEKIIEALEWYGLTPDEGPSMGGPFAPYVQSQRLEIYKPFVSKLLEQGSGYYCFCSAERLEQLRQTQQAQKLPPRYDKHCTTIPFSEARARVEAGESAVVRLNVPTTGTVTHTDLIRGQIEFRLDQIDDAVLLKSDGFPTYHLANVVDDHLMDITHVIRAEEWLPSVPKHRLLYQAFGWTPPMFAHLPLLLGQDGSKLSKRHGATSALAFRDLGYLPETMKNFLTLMGWHPKGDQELLTLPDILKQFRLEDVHPSGAKFDQAKLDWMNGWYIRQLPIEELLQHSRNFWTVPNEPQAHDRPWLQRALSLVQDRITVLSEIPELINFVFADTWDRIYQSCSTDVFIPKKGTIDRTFHSLSWVAEQLKNFGTDWKADNLKVKIIQEIKDSKRTNIEVLWPLRTALSLRAASPDVFDLLDLLGPEESLRRIAKVLQKLGE